jgi:hypothetical protein
MNTTKVIFTLRGCKYKSYCGLRRFLIRRINTQKITNFTEFITDCVDCSKTAANP